MAMTSSKSAFNLQFALLAGTTATTDIAVTGIVTTDKIVWCGEFTSTASIASLADRTSETSITSNGQIQLASTNSTSNSLLLIWIDTSL